MAKDLEKDCCCEHDHHHEDGCCCGHTDEKKIQELREKLAQERAKGNTNSVSEGKVVTVEFKVYDNDTDELLEDTKEVGPFFYIQGMGAFVPKIEEVLTGKKAGYKDIITLTIEEGYGEHDEELVVEMDRKDFVEFEDIYIGLDFIADLEDGSEQSFVITKIEDDVVTADGNHPFAGRNVRFELELIGVREATEKELEFGEPLFEGF
ncbi:peptidylprolyl isomerase [Fusobacterium sp. FSA-380-WT-3A]|nr:peptidylprolyl isomerase [Fusobacterium sp. FSA-380-WT-3A]